MSLFVAPEAPFRDGPRAFRAPFAVHGASFSSHVATRRRSTARDEATATRTHLLMAGRARGRRTPSGRALGMKDGVGQFVARRRNRRLQRRQAGSGTLQMPNTVNAVQRLPEATRKHARDHGSLLLHGRVAGAVNTQGGRVLPAINNNHRKARGKIRKRSKRLSRQQHK